MTSQPTDAAVLDFARSRILQSKDLEARGVSRTRLSLMVAAGTLERLGRGLYVAPDFDHDENLCGVPVKITSPAKSVVDCFKFRSKIGVSVAVEALRDAWVQRKATADELWKLAEICRMTNVMRPYFESLMVGR